jgi:hypothetical protein
MADRDTVFAELEKRNFFEVYEVTTYKGFREPQGGGVQEVTVEVWDRGPDFGELRFSVKATDDEERLATGNPGSTLENAIMNVHWFDLDKPAR